MKLAGNFVSLILLMMVLGKGATGQDFFKKDLLYDKHTLEDDYDYGKVDREFQWEKIDTMLMSLKKFEKRYSGFGVLENYKNEHGQAPLSRDAKKDKYGITEDIYGIARNQAIPMYKIDDLSIPERYGRDGSYVAILSDSADYVKLTPATFGGEWYVPKKYVRLIGPLTVTKVVFVDRTNQNIASMELVDGEWVVRSMNPATTGLERPPYKQETPSGIYFVQDKREKMYYTNDGSSEIVGFAPYASRFTRGAYIHGVPVNNVNGSLIEYSQTLGTTPLSHMCVRNATSHAKFIYEWAPVDEALVFVFD